MSPTTIVAGVSGVVIAMVVAALWWQTSRLETANMTIGNQAGAIIGLKGEIALNDAIDEADLAFDKAFEKQAGQFDILRQEILNANTQQALTAYDDSKNDPRSFADNASVELARWMCRVEADGDADKLRRCAETSAEAYLGGKSYVFTITPEVAEDFRIRCENYKYWQFEASDEARDSKDLAVELKNGLTYTQRIKGTYVFCDYTITGFTSDGWYIMIMPYLNQIEAKLGEWKRWGDDVQARLDSAVAIAKQLKDQRNEK